MSIRYSFLCQTIFICFVLLFSAVIDLNFSGCQKNQDQKTENTQDTQKNVQVAASTTSNYITEYPVYKTNSEKLITAIRDTLESLKSTLRKVNAKLRASLDSAEQVLERENVDLQARLESFKADGQDSWLQFKKQFDQSMDSVRSNLRELHNKYDHIKAED